MKAKNYVHVWEISSFDGSIIVDVPINTDDTKEKFIDTLKIMIEVTYPKLKVQKITLGSGFGLKVFNEYDNELKINHKRTYQGATLNDINKIVNNFTIING